MSSYPHLVRQGDIAKGEIAIVLDPEKMAAIERSAGREVGIVYRDKYWIWVNDACQFPNGQYGVYGRILSTKAIEGITGVAVMPILKNGKVALICNFRHATRTWEIELPRGRVDLGESIEEAAKREVLEETGLNVDQLVLLGSMPPDTGMSSTVAPIFAAHVVSQSQSTPEPSEAIEGVFELSIDEIRKAFVSGFYTCTIRGQEQKVAFRDPFLAYALLIYDFSQVN
jgi:ADP-ribose pyrophosphatase